MKQNVWETGEHKGKKKSFNQLRLKYWYQHNSQSKNCNYQTYLIKNNQETEVMRHNPLGLLIRGEITIDLCVSLWTEIFMKANPRD